MENIQLNNGTTVLIGSNRDVIETIGEHCSYELADLVERKYKEDIEELQLKCQAESDEKENYERDIEGKTALLHDAVESIVDLMDYMRDAKRIDKEKIFTKLQNIHDDIWNEL